MNAARWGLPNVRIARLLPAAIWTSTALLWVFLIGTQFFLPTESWLLDWHVYAAGASDFVGRELYHTPLDSPYTLPVDEFNYPPLAAIAVLPLLPLPDSAGGTIWVVINLAAMAATCVLMARILGARDAVLWGALAFLAYSIHPWLMLAFLGNNTPLVLLLVTAFAHEHLRGRGRSAGVLLGLAIALKLWPAALIPLLLRERRWDSLGSASVVVGFVIVGSLAWLGLNAVGPALDAMQARAEIEPGNPVFYISWLRETQDWWPSWGGYVVAGILAALPTRGKLGIGLGVFAGLALVPNLWRTYAPSLVVAAALCVKGIREGRASAKGAELPATLPPDRLRLPPGLDSTR